MKMQEGEDIRLKERPVDNVWSRERLLYACNGWLRELASSTQSRRAASSLITLHLPGMGCIRVKNESLLALTGEEAQYHSTDLVTKVNAC